MRLLFTVLLLSSFALAQEAQPPTPREPTEPAEDKPAPEGGLDGGGALPEPVEPWMITKPESKPQGEPVQLKVARDPSKKRTIDLMLEQAPAVKMGITGEVSVTASGFSLPFRFTKFEQMGMDMTAQVAAMTGTIVTGKLSASGTIEGGSVTVQGFGAMGSQLAILGYMAMPECGARSAKVGEVWELDVASYGPRFGTAQKTEGSVFQALEVVEDRDGVKCARIRTSFGLKFTGMMSPMGAVDVSVRGATTDWVDMDGHLRYRSTEFEQIGPMGTGKVTVTVSNKISDAAPAAPACGCGGACGAGCGCGGDTGSACGCGE